MRHKRYERNGTSISEADNEVLKDKKVCIIGCGGLGGFIAEMLLRVGILNLTLIDPDVFDVTNLNRQLFSTEKSVGKSKVTEAKKRLLSVDKNAKILALQEKLDESNAHKLLAGHDAVVDALDSLAARRIAASSCRKLGIPFVHGAIGGWYGQVSVILPDSERSIDELYKNINDDNIDKSMGNLPFVAGYAACIQCSETVKLLLGKEPNLLESVARFDMLNIEHNVFGF